MDLHRFDEGARSAVMVAGEVARRQGRSIVFVEDLLVAAAEVDGPAATALAAVGVSATDVEQASRIRAGSAEVWERPSEGASYARSATEVLHRSGALTTGEISTGTLLAAIVQLQPNGGAALLASLGVDLDDVRTALEG